MATWDKKPNVERGGQNMLHSDGWRSAGSWYEHLPHMLHAAEATHWNANVKNVQQYSNFATHHPLHQNTTETP